MLRLTSLLGIMLAMLIAFVALVALASALFIWPQTLLGMKSPITVDRVLGWVNAPLAGSSNNA